MVMQSALPGIREERMKNMLCEREQRTAEQFGITEQIELLKQELLTVNGVVDVEFDLDGFWSDIKQVIIIPKYQIPFANFYDDRRAMLTGILAIANKHNLRLTGDRIEDYGAHLYIVTETRKQ